MIVLLDSGLLGIPSNPNSLPTVQACQIWAEELIAKRHGIIVPEIADYEVRRELLRANKQAGLRRLDRVKTRFRYLSITTKTMLKAAEFWA